MQSHQAEFTGDRRSAANGARGPGRRGEADSVDESAIRARSAEVAAVQADAAVLRAKVHQEVFSLLTAEQQAKAKELRAQAQTRMKERASRMRERRGRAPVQG